MVLPSAVHVEADSFMRTIYNEYELTFILKPELGEDVNTRTIEKLLGVIERYEGVVLINDSWGRRKLAYPIERHQFGFYVYLNYVGPAGLPHEMERLIRIDDNIIRFLTVKLSDDIDAEEIKSDAVARHQEWVERRNIQEERRPRE